MCSFSVLCFCFLRLFLCTSRFPVALYVEPLRGEIDAKRMLLSLGRSMIELCCSKSDSADYNMKEIADVWIVGYSHCVHVLRCIVRSNPTDKRDTHVDQRKHDSEHTRVDLSFVRLRRVLRCGSRKLLWWRSFQGSYCTLHPWKN